jgi:hypothetical protein
LEEATEEEDVQDNDRDDDDDEDEEDDEGRYGVSEGQVVFLPPTIPGMSPSASPRRSNTISVSPYSPSPLPSSPSRWASARSRTMSAAGQGQNVSRSPYSSYAGGEEDVDVTPKASAFHPQRPSVVGSRRASATSSPTTATFGGGRPRSPSVAGSATMYSTLRGHQDLSPLVLSSLSGPRSGSPLPRSPTPSQSQYANNHNNHNMHLGLTGPMSPTTTQNYHHHHYSTSNNSLSSNGTSNSNTNSNPVSLSHTSGSSPSSSPLPTPPGGEEGRGPLTPSRNTFNLRRASQQCKSIPGYVSFAQVDGLGEPEDEEEPEAGAGADAGGVKRKIRKWAVSWFSQQQQQQLGEH